MEKETWTQRFNRLLREGLSIAEALADACNYLHSMTDSGVTMAHAEYAAIRHNALAIAHWAHCRMVEEYPWKPAP